MSGPIFESNGDDGGNCGLTILLVSASLGSVTFLGVLYFFKRLKFSKRQAEEDRQNFVFVYVPVLLLAAFSLWLLFFMNPFGGRRLGPSRVFVSGLQGFEDKVSDESFLGDERQQKKFGLGFLLGTATIMLAMRVLNDRKTTEATALVFTQE